jgi:hypothetical protein
MGNAFKKFRMHLFGISWVIVLTDKHTYTHIHTQYTNTYTHTYTNIHTHTNSILTISDNFALFGRVQGRRNRGGGHRGHMPPSNFFKGLKVPFFVIKSALFVQANVAVNTKLTSKVPFFRPAKVPTFHVKVTHSAFVPAVPHA